MRRIAEFFERGNILPITLVAAAFTGIAGLLGFLLVPVLSEPEAEMRIEPNSITVTNGDLLTIDIVVHASTPVNVFAGELQFNPEILRVDSIDYNTSIADLWAELPWYHNGDGTLNFAGGTTRPGGFFGTGSLIKVHFRTLSNKTGSLSIKDARILKHDGIGTDIPLREPIDAIVTIEQSTDSNVLRKSIVPARISVVPEPPDTDLSNDGRTSIADISIFMVHMAAKNLRSDLNKDGTVNTRDFSILMDAIRRR